MTLKLEVKPNITNYIWFIYNNHILFNHFILWLRIPWMFGVAWKLKNIKITRTGPSCCEEPHHNKHNYFVIAWRPKVPEKKPPVATLECNGMFLLANNLLLEVKRTLTIYWNPPPRVQKQTLGPRAESSPLLPGHLWKKKKSNKVDIKDVSSA